MVGENHLGTGRNLEMAGIDSLVFQPFHFFQKALGIHHYAGTDNADGAGIHDTAWHKAERICLAAGDYCVACVVPALGTNHHVCLCGQIIYDLAFAFIAPLGTNYHCCCHYSFFLPESEFPSQVMGKFTCTVFSHNYAYIIPSEWKWGKVMGCRIQWVRRVRRVQKVADCPSGVKVLKMDRPYGPEGS